MSVLEHQVSQYIGALRGTERENAQHCLIELGPEVISLVATHFEREPDASIRSILVHIAWQTRSSDALPLLIEALNETEPSVWKEALDGLVTLGGSPALDVIRQARARMNAEKAEWLDEAIEQIADAMNNTGHPGIRY